MVPVESNSHMSDTKVLKNSTVSGSLDVVSFPAKRGTEFTSSIAPWSSSDSHMRISSTSKTHRKVCSSAGSCMQEAAVLCVFWHRSSVELDSRHSQHSSVSLGQPCLCCQFTGYPLIDIMNTGKIPSQDVFKDALTPISKLATRILFHLFLFKSLTWVIQLLFGLLRTNQVSYRLVC